MRQAYDGGTARPLGPLSRAVGAGDYVFVAGTVGSREDGSFSESVGEQTAQTLENIRSHLRAAGSDLDDVVDVTVYLVDPGDYAEMNEAYGRYFGDPPPARATVCCRLIHPEHLVEISAVAYTGGPS